MEINSPVNSTTVLQLLKNKSAEEGENSVVSIEHLATEMDITIPALVSVLTELEHRDEITMQISSEYNLQTNDTTYTGTVRLMKTPPDKEPMK